MRVARAHAYGPAESVVVEEIARPTPGPGEVLVDIAAAAVNFPDLLILNGGYQVSWPLPIIPGSEFAGTVAAIGDGVSALKVGDRVAGSVAVGAFAEFVVVPAKTVWAIPAGVDFADAAAFRVTYLTAYHALRSVAAVQPGEWVVVLGAAGGVGLAAVDIATALGARVVAAASSEEKLQACRERGAVATLDYTKPDFKDELKQVTEGGADVVLDPVGGPYSEAALRATRWGARFVVLGFAAGEIPRIPLNLVLLKGVSIHGMEIRTFGEHLPDLVARDEAEAFAAFGEDRLRPYIGARFELDDVVKALQVVRDRRAIGKIVVTMPGHA